MLHHVDWQMVIDVLKECNAFIFMVRQSSHLDCLTQKIKALQSFERSITVYQLMWHTVHIASQMVLMCTYVQMGRAILIVAAERCECIKK